MVSTRLLKQMDRCLDVAKTSEHDTKVGTVLLKKGRVVLETVNTRKTHPIQASWAKRAGSPRKIHLHSEIRALTLCREEFDTMIVGRVDKTGKVKDARPCRICMGAIDELEGVSVYYSTELGEWEEL